MPPSRDFKQHKEDRKPEFFTDQVVELEDVYAPIEQVPPAKVKLSFSVDKKYLPALDIILKTKLNQSEMYSELLSDYVARYQERLDQARPERTDTRRRHADDSFAGRYKRIVIYATPELKAHYHHVAAWARTDYEAIKEAVEDYLLKHLSLLRKKHIDLEKLLSDDE